MPLRGAARDKTENLETQRTPRKHKEKENIKFRGYTQDLPLTAFVLLLIPFASLASFAVQGFHPEQAGRVFLSRCPDR